ncbi:MAG: hypothetical protein AAFX06_00580 [Planctomycetota bacterium]
MFSFGGSNSTFLVITDREVMRADVRGGQITALTKEPRPVGTTLPIAVELACGLTGRKPTQKTYVIADDFWTGVIDLDERSIYGLEGEELEQMLRFETESLSDLDPVNSRLGFVELATVPPDTRRFWGAAVPSEILSGVAQAVRVRGGKLEMLANPIGMSSPDRSGVPWVEFTSELAGAFAAPAESGGLPRAYVTQRSATSDRWYDALGTLFGGELPPVGWQSSPEDRPPRYTGSLESLSDEPILERWLQGVVTRVSNPAGFPHITAPQPPTSDRTFVAVGATTALLVAIVCGVLAWTMKSRVAEMNAEIERLEEPAAQKKRLSKVVADLTTELEDLRGRAEEAESKRANLRVLVDQGDRFAVLLLSLAEQSGDYLVVDAVTPEATGLVLSGRAIRSDAVTQMVQRLETDVAPVGWGVRPPSVSGSNQTTGGGPWTFEIELVDRIPAMDSGQETSSSLASLRTAPSATNDRRGTN